MPIKYPEFVKRKARKDYQCTWCPATIKKGEYYWREEGLYAEDKVCFSHMPEKEPTK